MEWLEVTLIKKQKLTFSKLIAVSVLLGSQQRSVLDTCVHRGGGNCSCTGNLLEPARKKNSQKYVLELRQLLGTTIRASNHTFSTVLCLRSWLRRTNHAGRKKDERRINKQGLHCNICLLCDQGSPHRSCSPRRYWPLYDGSWLEEGIVVTYTVTMVPTSWELPMKCGNASPKLNRLITTCESQTISLWVEPNGTSTRWIHHTWADSGRQG